MKKVKNIFVLVAFMVLGLFSVTIAAPTTYMDVALHNGGFDVNSPGFWSDPCAIPYEWELVAGAPYTTSSKFIQIGTDGEAVNNTGELVMPGHAYTVQADLGGGSGTHPWVRVYATENSDGTGNKVELVGVDRIGLSGDGYDLFTVSNTSSGVSSSLEGYYVQVRIGGPYADFGYYIAGNYDNIVVTSDVATTMTYMNSSLHNGSLTPASSTGHWYNTSGAIPDEWVETNLYMYTGALHIQTGTLGEAVCNTGELVLGGHAYTIEADLGGFIGSAALVQVYATKNADGTGARALLAELTRAGTEDNYDLHNVSNTGAGIAESLTGYYLQVKIGDPGGTYTGGFYDNIVVTSEEATPEPTMITYMDSTLHNGSFSDAALGHWYNTPAAIPDEWEETHIYMYTAGATRFLQTGTLGEAVCNTGEQVIGSHAYTVQADLGGWTGTTDAIAAVRVYATKNADGSGARALLTQVTREATDASGYDLYTVSSTGTGIPESLEGYYIQVKIGDQDGTYTGGFYDNIVIKSEEATPEPVTVTFMDAILHNGSLTASSAGSWSTVPAAIPAGWEETRYGYNYTTALNWTQISTSGGAVNNTGETVLVSNKYRVQADLGGGENTDPTVKVYATENADGTGNKLLLTSVHRVGQIGDGYDLFTVSGQVSATTPPSVEGYYVQVVLDDIGYYDNIVVTSESSVDIPTITYMDATLHNGGMVSTDVGGFWSDHDFDANFIPFEWSSTNEPNTYTAASAFIIFDSVVDAVTNNTGETVPANHKFSIQADLGSHTGATAKAFVYATENADGTGDAELLAQVSRAGDDADGFDLFTVSSTGSATDSSIEGYYVQVLLQTVGDVNQMGYYDNLVVTSKDATPIYSKTYMDPNLHNGAMTASVPGDGYWTDPAHIPFGGWVANDPAYGYTFSTMFSAIESSGEAINNTQETVIGNHKFTVEADLGGFTGATASVLVYATENWDGTGDKVLLVDVNRPGDDADGLDLFTVSNTSSEVLPTLDGYYVQVALKTSGTGGTSGFYDNITVTSGQAVCGDAEHPYLLGDINEDCYVNFEDLEIFIGQWLVSGCSAPDWCEGADLVGDTSVNFEDFASLAENWMDCTDPEAPCGYNP